MHKHLLTAAVALCLPAGAALAEDITRLTVDQAVQEADRVNDQLRAARARAEAADDTSRSTRGQLLPALSATEQWQHYDSPFVINLAPGQGTTVRNINTNTVVLSASQPVLGLIHLGYGLSSANHTADASHSDAQVAAASLGEQVRTTYLRLFEARAQAGIAQTSVEELDKQVQDAQSRYRAGTITNADLLRFQTASANAQQQLIQAQTDALVYRQTLLTYLARNPEDVSIEFIEPDEPTKALVGEMVEKLTTDLARA